MSSTTSTSSSICWGWDGRLRALSRQRPLPDPDRPERWRLFVAAPMPPDAAARAWDQLAEVRSRHPELRWLPPEKLHLTLVFLGQTEASLVSGLSDAVAGVAAGTAPFDVVTGSAGGRVGGRRGGVAWLRLADGGHDVARLSVAVDDAIGSHTYGARNVPRPHLTVARGVDEAALTDLQASTHGLRLSWTVDRIVLFRSHTGPGGSRYEELSGARLGA